MTQKQRPQENNATNSSSQNLRGNYAAKLQADKIEIPEIPFSSDDYFDNCKLEPNGLCIGGGMTPEEWALMNYQRARGMVPGVLKEKKERFKAYIKAGHIDPKTMGWVNTLQGHDNKVCICLDFSCRIGPFIPVRKSMDK